MMHLKAAQLEGKTLREFQNWAKTQDWQLPKYRLETIYRNAAQTAYQAGHWRDFEEHATNRPYLMYDAINDSRVRPSHLALDGIIKPVGDVFWKTHAAPMGHRCRCTLRSLSRAEAMAKGGVTQNVPAEGRADEGWGHKPTEWGKTLGELVRKRINLCGVANFATGGTKSGLVHCQSEAAFNAMQRALASVDNSAMNETFIKQSIGLSAWDAATLDLSARKLPPGVVSAGLTMAEQVSLYTWTLDTSKGPWFSRINRVLRMGDVDSAEFETVWPLVAGIKSAMDKLPPFEGMVYRAIKERGMTAHQLAWFNDAYKIDSNIALEGYSGTSKDLLQILKGRYKLTIMSKTGRDISAFSSKADQAEVLIPHGAVIRVTRVLTQENGVIRIWADEI
jgi:SPP1 gp7 family putative phage head morphogenesis protein